MTIILIMPLATGSSFAKYDSAVEGTFIVALAHTRLGSYEQPSAA
jgi:hypothetical protein